MGLFWIGIDLHINVPAVEVEKIVGTIEKGESSLEIRRKVVKARQIQESDWRSTKFIAIAK